MRPKRKPRKRITKEFVQATENDPPPATVPDIAIRPEADEDGWEQNGLTVRQQLFVDALIGPASGNATKAAEIAGYSSENRRVLTATGSRLLTFVNVREAIARALARANLTADWVRQMTAALAASNMGAFLKLDDKGEPIIDWQQAESRGAFVQIRKYKEKGAKIGGGSLEIIERQIETHNPAPYLQLLARLLGMTDDRPQTNVTVRVDNKFDYDSFAQQFADFARNRLCVQRDETTSGNGHRESVHPEGA